MIDDFKMISHRFDDSIKIIPVSDVHLGSIEHNKDAWKAFCSKIAAADNTYIMLGGDLINNSVRCSVANPFDETMRPMEQKLLMTEYLKPISDKILCAVSGNHEARTTKESDQDITYDIMCKLGIENLYRKNAAFVKCGIGVHNINDKVYPNTNYVFCMTHGSGGGILTGATVNKNERFGNIIEGIDCLIVGHTHKGSVTKPSKLVVNANKEIVYSRPYTVISMVPWLSYGGYALGKMLLPAAESNPQILTLENSRDKKITIEW